MRWLALAAALVAVNLAAIGWIARRDRGSDMSAPSARAVAIAQGLRLREADFLTIDCSRCEVTALRPVGGKRWVVALSNADRRQCFSVPADPVEQRAVQTVAGAARRVACPASQR
jgi:hypothetical protein